MAAHGQFDESAITRARRARISSLMAMAMPSVTVMVQNSRGVPPAQQRLSSPLGLAHKRDVAGGGLIQQEATPISGW